MSLLPSFAQKTYISQTTQQDTSLSLYEYDVDFGTGQFTGKRVNGREAVKVWIWKCLMTTRFYFPIYSWMYGSELESYIGRALPQEYIDTDVKLALQDALLINPEISEIRNFSGYQKGDVLYISFTAVTKYGAVDINDIRIEEFETYAQRGTRRALLALQNEMVYFSKLKTGNIGLHTATDVEKVVTFLINDDGHLIARMTDDFAGRASVTLTDTHHVKVGWNV